MKTLFCVCTHLKLLVWWFQTRLCQIPCPGFWTWWSLSCKHFPLECTNNLQRKANLNEGWSELPGITLWRSQPAVRAAQMHSHYYLGFNPKLRSVKTVPALNTHTAPPGRDREGASLPQHLEVITFFQPCASVSCIHFLSGYWESSAPVSDPSLSSVRGFARFKNCPLAEHKC